MLLWGVLVLLALTLVLVAAPSLLSPVVARRLSTVAGAPVRVGWISWNPLALDVTLHDVALAPAPGAPAVVTVKRIEVNVSARHLLAGELALDALALDQPWIDLRRTASGDFNLAAVLARLDGASGTAASAAAPPLLKIARFRIRRGSVEFHDETTRPPLDTSLYVDDAVARDLELAQTGEGNLALHLESRVAEQQLTLDLAYVAHAADSDLRVTLITTHASLARVLVDVPLGWQQVSGSLDATLTYRREVTGGRLHTHGVEARVTLHDVALGEPWAEEPPLRAGLIRLDNVSADLLTQQTDLGAITAEDFRLLVVRGEEGLHVPLSTTSTGAGDSAWTTRLATVTLGRGMLVVRDLLPGAPELVAEIRSGTIQPRGGTTAFRADAVVADGRVALDGIVDEANTRIAFDLEDVSVPEAATDLGLPLRFSTGRLAGHLDSVFRNGTGHFTGRLTTSEVKSAPGPEHPEEVFAWHALALRLEDSTFVPLRIHVSHGDLSWLYLMLHRRDDGLYPFVGVHADEAGTDAPTDAARPAEPQPPMLVVDHATIDGGRIEFYDTVLPKAYGADLLELQGSVEDLRFPPLTFGRGTLQASIDELSPVSAHGTLHTREAEGTITVDRLFLAPLNPYIEPALDYEIQAGLARVSSEITRKDASLQADNEIVLSRFALRAAGRDRFAAELGQPLTVALALMKDARGDVHLDVPIEVDLEHQRYQVRASLLAALRAGFLGALQAPLRLLGSAFRRDPGERFDLRPIPFAAGSAAIEAEAETRLAQLARLLQRHPTLRAVLVPYASTADAAVLATQEGAAVDPARLAALVDARIAAIEQGLSEPHGIAATRVAAQPWRATAPLVDEDPGVDLQLRGD
jgi:Domain of Unknown Function (DUF748)/AsmA family